MIAVNGDEKVDLENTKLYQKASRSSLTSVKCMLFITTCCINKSTSYIYLFNDRKEKCTFSTRPRVVKDQISQEIFVGIVIFLCLQTFTSQASLDPNSTSKARTKQSSLDLE